MKIRKKISVEQVEIVSMLCDICGKECMKEDGGIEGVSITEMPSYGSQYDGMVWSCELCDDCMKKKVDEGMGRLV